MTRPWVRRACLLGAGLLSLALFWQSLRDGNDLLATINLGSLAWLIVAYARLDLIDAQLKLLSMHKDHLLTHLEALGAELEPARPDEPATLSELRRQLRERR